MLSGLDARTARFRHRRGTCPSTPRASPVTTGRARPSRPTSTRFSTTTTSEPVRSRGRFPPRRPLPLKAGPSLGVHRSLGTPRAPRLPTDSGRWWRGPSRASGTRRVGTRPRGVSTWTAGGGAPLDRCSALRPKRQKRPKGERSGGVPPFTPFARGAFRASRAYGAGRRGAGREGEMGTLILGPAGVLPRPGAAARAQPTGSTHAARRQDACGLRIYCAWWMRGDVGGTSPQCAGRWAMCPLRLAAHPSQPTAH